MNINYLTPKFIGNERVKKNQDNLEEEQLEDLHYQLSRFIMELGVIKAVQRQIDQWNRK